mgnify:CR=1 FL=1
MIPTTGQTVNLNQAETVQAWADIVVRIWEDKVQQLNITDTLTLLNSFAVHVQQAAGGRVDYVVFAYRYYGRFQDMGVGKYQPLEKVGSNLLAKMDSMGKRTRSREPRRWYSPTFYSQLIKLSEILAEKYAQKSALTVVLNIDDNAMKWDKQHVKV